MRIDAELWTASLLEILGIVTAWLPKLAGALVWLVLGWAVAALTRVVLASGLHRIGFDKLLSRAGVAGFLDGAGIKVLPSRVIAGLIYWTLLLIFILAATESIGLSRVVDTLGSLVDYMPNVIAAVLILLFGGLIARVSDDAISGLTNRSGTGLGRMPGRLMRYAVLGFAVILALQQLQIETTLLNAAVIALLAGIVLTFALSFGLGTRDLARNIMAGFHAKEAFRVGQRLTVGGHSGRLRSIGTVKAELETDNGLVSIPNTSLTDETVLISADTADP